MEEIIREIDPSLKYRRKLIPSSVLVYEVEKEGTIYILKIARNERSWEVNHLKQESEILGLAKGIGGITHLVQKYESIGDYSNQILKEFYEGKDLFELNTKIYDTKVQKKLENTVRELHSLGVARLDLNRPQNIILSPDKQDVCLIDLGYGLLSKDINPSEFEWFKLRDLLDLEGRIFL